VWYSFEILHLLTNQISITLLYQKTAILIWLVNAKCPVRGCYRNAAGTQPFIFKFGWSRRQSSLSQTAIRKVVCCNSSLLLAEQ